MKRFLLFILAGVLTGVIIIPLHAQKPVLIGVKGSVSIPNLSGGNNEVSEGYTSRLAPNFGVQLEIPLAGNFSVQPEINFAGQGGKRDGLQPITQMPQGFPPNPTGGYYYANFNNVAVLNYIEIPVLARLRWGKTWQFYSDAGPHIGFLLNAKTKTSGDSYVYLDKEGTQPVTPQPVNFENEEDVKDDINSINAGITGGIGLTHKAIGGEIFLDSRFAYGFTNIQKDTETNGKSHTGNVVITLGYAHRFGKKQK